MIWLGVAGYCIIAIFFMGMLLGCEGDDFDASSFWVGILWPVTVIVSVGFVIGRMIK